MAIYDVLLPVTVESFIVFQPKTKLFVFISERLTIIDVLEHETTLETA